MTHLFKTHFLCLTSFTPHNHTVNELGRLVFILIDKEPEPLNVLAKLIYAHGRARIGAQSFLGRKNIIINILTWNNSSTLK